MNIAPKRNRINFCCANVSKKPNKILKIFSINLASPSRDFLCVLNTTKLSVSKGGQSLAIHFRLCAVQFRWYSNSTKRCFQCQKCFKDWQDSICLVRYIQAATSPKDIVILLDASGSMTGQRMEIAKATVEKILDTLSDDDFFNIIWVCHRNAFATSKGLRGDGECMISEAFVYEQIPKLLLRKKDSNYRSGTILGIRCKKKVCENRCDVSGVTGYRATSHVYSIEFSSSPTNRCMWMIASTEPWCKQTQTIRRWKLYSSHIALIFLHFTGWVRKDEVADLWERSMTFDWMNGSRRCTAFYWAELQVLNQDDADQSSSGALVSDLQRLYFRSAVQCNTTNGDWIWPFFSGWKRE